MQIVRQSDTPPEPHDAALEGRVERVEALYRGHHRRVFRAAYRLTGNVAEAEDVLQTVFSRLLRNLPDADLGSGWGPYLHRAAVNAGVDLLRARARRSWTALSESDSEPARDERDPEAAADLAEQKTALRRALRDERPRTAQIFALRYFEGYTNTEIADMVGIRRAAVAVTLHRVRARLKKQLGDER